MRARMTLELCDPLILEPATDKGPCTEIVVTVSETMSIDVGLSAEGFKRAFQNAIGTAMLPVFEKLQAQHVTECELKRAEWLRAKQEAKQAEEAKKAEEAKAKAKSAPVKEPAPKPVQTDGDPRGN